MTSRTRSRLSAFVQGRLQAERRQVKRLAPGQRTVCLFGPPGGPAREGLVHNLSVKGAGLLADCPVPLKARLCLLFINAGHTCALSVDAQVVRCEDAGDGRFFVGAAFGRTLRYDEVVPFLA